MNRAGCWARAVARAALFVVAVVSFANTAGAQVGADHLRRHLHDSEAWFEGGYQGSTGGGAVNIDGLFNGTGDPSRPSFFLGVDLNTSAAFLTGARPSTANSISAGFGVKAATHLGSSGGTNIIPDVGVLGTLQTDRLASFTPYVDLKLLALPAPNVGLKFWTGPVVDVGQLKMTIHDAGGIATFDKSFVRVGGALGISLEGYLAGGNAVRVGTHCEFLPGQSVVGSIGPTRFEGSTSTETYCGVNVGYGFTFNTGRVPGIEADRGRGGVSTSGFSVRY